MPALVYYQESIKIGGVIYDRETNIPLADCHIYIEGTNIGTISNENGEFSISVPLKHYYKTIKISHVGFITLEKKLALIQHRGMSIPMDYDVVVLEEVVVTPQGKDVLDQVMDEVIVWYDSREEMLADFYAKLIKMDKDQRVLREVLEEERLAEAKNN
jgi:hypothetical protein